MVIGTGSLELKGKEKGPAGTLGSQKKQPKGKRCLLGLGRGGRWSDWGGRGQWGGFPMTGEDTNI